MHTLPRACVNRVKCQLQPHIFLAYLLERPRTGRELMTQIEADSGVRLSPGTVYPLLRRLEKRGLLVSHEGSRQVIYRPADRAKAKELVQKETDACAATIDYYRKLARTET